MLCDICHKKEAVVHFTEIIDNQITKLHLCEECAHSKGLQFPFGKPLFSMADLLAGLTNFDVYSTEQKAKIKCQNCGLTYDDFKRRGKLGCGECYSSFKVELTPLLKRIHGATSHLGKTPSLIVKPSRRYKKSMAVEDQIKKFQLELQDAVRKEEYERAAILRDKIKALKEKNDKNDK